MTIVAGIDEAGLGPVLGPLVVSASAFSVPAESAGASMWRLLSGAVGRTPGRRKAPVVIGDSKRLFSRQSKAGLAHLERGVLAMLRTRGASIGSLRELLAMLAPAAQGQLLRYPWYAAGDVPLPRTVSPTNLSLCSHALTAAMSAAGIRLKTVRVEPVFVEEFNRLVQATNNKATTAWNITSRLLLYLWKALPDENLRVYVDRQGGRIRYLPGLELIFDGCRFKILDEAESVSAYRIACGQRWAEIHFLVDGEQKRLPVAFASMLSKYMRELFMGLLNSFWGERVPDLAATAGYHVDGQRFYRQIRSAARRLGVDERTIYRSR